MDSSALSGTKRIVVMLLRKLYDLIRRSYRGKRRYDFIGLVFINFIIIVKMFIVIHDSLTTISNDVIFSRNFEAFASKFLRDLEEKFLRYYTHTHVTRCKSSIARYCVTRYERLIMFPWWVTCSDHEECLQDFLAIMNRLLQNPIFVFRMLSIFHHIAFHMQLTSPIMNMTI